MTSQVGHNQLFFVNSDHHNGFIIGFSINEKCIYGQLVLSRAAQCTVIDGMGSAADWSLVLRLG